jgi:Antirestriction protein
VWGPTFVYRFNLTQEYIMKTSATQTIVKGNSQKAKKGKIIATSIPDSESFDFLPKFFGKALEVRGELLVHEFVERISGGHGIHDWNFYTLSNGGFFLAPNWEEEVHASWACNGFDDMLSPDAVGIFSTLLAIHMLASERQDKRLGSHYYRLLDFAAVHPEAAKIFRAID